MSVHEHEKIMNEKIHALDEQKTSEINNAREKYQQQLRHLTETHSLKITYAQDEHKLEIQELTETIESLGTEIEALRDKDTELHQARTELHESQEKLASTEEKILEIKNEVNKLQTLKNKQITSLKEKIIRLKEKAKLTARSEKDAKSLISKKLETSEKKVIELEISLKDLSRSYSLLEQEKLALESKNDNLLQSYKEDLETIRAGMKIKSEEDQALFKKILDEKATQNELCQDAKQELQKVHKEYLNQKNQADSLRIETKESNRAIEEKEFQLKQLNCKLKHLKCELKQAQENISSIKHQEKIKKARLENAFKSALSSLKVEVLGIKSTMINEIDTFQKLIKSNMDGVVMKHQEILSRVKSTQTKELHEQNQRLQEKILEAELSSKEKIAALEKKITEIDCTSKEKIQRLENHNKEAFENLKRHYTDRLSDQAQNMENYKYEVKRDFDDNKILQDTILKNNVLQEIKRFESNVQRKSSKGSLTLSHLKPEKHSASTSNLIKIEEISKKLDSKIENLKLDSFTALSSSSSQFSPRRVTFGNTKATLGFMTNPQISKVS